VNGRLAIFVDFDLLGMAMNRVPLDKREGFVKA